MANKHLKRYSTSISISKCRLQLRFAARRAPATASDIRDGESWLTAVSSWSAPALTPRLAFCVRTMCIRAFQNKTSDLKKRKGAKDRCPGPHTLLEGLEIHASPSKHWVAVPLWVKHQKPALTATKHRCGNTSLRHPSGTHNGNTCVHTQPAVAPVDKGTAPAAQQGRAREHSALQERPQGGRRPVSSAGTADQAGALVMHS